MPARAAFLSTQHLMMLQGLSPTLNAAEFALAPRLLGTSDLDLMLGNAMSVPVVGTVAACALSLLRP